MKKIAVLLVLTLVVGVMMTLISVDEAVAAKVKLRVFTHTANWNELVKKNIAEFQKTHPDVTFDYSTVPHGEFETKLVIEIAAGTGPDITRIWTPNMYDYADNGWLAEAPEDVYQDIKENFIPKTLDGVSVRGKIYGYAAEAIIVLPIVNTKLYGEAGVKYPTSYKELMEVQEKLTKRSESGALEQIGVALANTDLWMIIHFCPVLWGYDGEFFNEDFTKGIFNTPAGLSAVKDYKVLAPIETIPDAFYTDKQATVISGPYMRGEYRELAPNLQYEVIPSLEGNNGKKINFAYFWTWVINNEISEEKKRISWDFLKFVNNEANVEELIGLSDYPLVRKDNIETFSGDPWLKMFADAWEFGKRFGSPRHFNEVYKAFTIEVERYLVGEITAEEALNTAETNVNAVLAGP